MPIVEMTARIQTDKATSNTKSGSLRHSLPGKTAKVLEADASSERHFKRLTGNSQQGPAGDSLDVMWGTDLRAVTPHKSACPEFWGAG